MSACPNCQIHSFMPFGFQDDTTFVYTAPVLSTEFGETNQTFLNHKAHFDSIQGSWIWIIDFAKTDMKHYISIGLTKKLSEYLNSAHSSKLKGIYLINPNFWLRNTIKLAKTVLPNLERKLKLIESTGTGLLLELGSMGVQHKWLMILKELLV